RTAFRRISRPSGNEATRICSRDRHSSYFLGNVISTPQGMDGGFSSDHYRGHLRRAGFRGRAAMADGAVLPLGPLFGNRVLGCGTSGWPCTNNRGPRFPYLFICWSFALLGVTCFLLPRADREIRGRDASETLGRPTLAGTAR